MHFPVFFLFLFPRFELFNFSNIFPSLLQGAVCFEHRIFREKSKKKNYSASVFGRLEDTADWPFFCELSALKIQKRTSAGKKKKKK